jgi:hypothetical protein
MPSPQIARLAGLIHRFSWRSPNLLPDRQLRATKPGTVGENAA